MSIKTRNLYISAIALMAFLGFGSSAFGQTSTSFKVTGPCVNCGSAYLEAAVLKINGVKKASYDADNFMLSLQYDDGLASEIDIQLELATKGFDAGDFAHDAGAELPACARSGLSRGDMNALGMEDTEELVDWESPDNLAELEALGRRGDDDSEISDEMLLEEENENDEELMDWEPIEIDPEEEDGNP